MLTILNAVGAAEIIELFIDIITAVLTGIPSALASGFESLVTSGSGTEQSFSLLFIWGVVLFCFNIGVRFVFTIFNKVKA